MSSNAAKEWFGTFKELGEKRDKLIQLIRHNRREHHERDEAETEAELDRDIRRAKTALSLDESLKKVDHFLKTNRPRMGQGQLYCLAHSIEKLANYGQLRPMADSTRLSRS